MSDFTHLHVHSHYSVLQSPVRIHQLVRRARELGMKRLALTDSGNLSAAFEFGYECRRHGIQSIIGCELVVPLSCAVLDSAGDAGAGDRGACYRLVCLAASEAGYRSLLRLAGISPGTVTSGELKRYAEGLIVFSSGQTESVARDLRACFGANYYLEIVDHGLEADHATIELQVALARELGIGVVASNDVYYTVPGDAEWLEQLRRACSEVRLAAVPPVAPRTAYLKTCGEMTSLFVRYPEALHATGEIADRCLFTPSPAAPRFPVAVAADGLRRLCFRRLAERRVDPVPRYRQRLEHELRVIIACGLEGYFLFVHDYTSWARRAGILLGPGCAAAPSSLVLYLLGITDIDPLRHGLLFERFLSERGGSPLCEIQLEAEYERQHEIFSYIETACGSDRVADVARFRTHAGVHVTVEADPVTIAVAPNSLAEHTALYAPSGSGRPITQYAREYVTDAGLTPVTVIGSRALSMLKELALRSAGGGGTSVDITRIPPDDPATLELFAAGETEGIPGFDGAAMRDCLQRLRPETLTDLVALGTLCRSELHDLIDDFVTSGRRRNRSAATGPAQAELPAAADLLCETRGLLVYQEQLLQVLQRLLDCPLSQANEIRKAWGRKNADQLEAIRRRFAARGVGQPTYTFLEQRAPITFLKAHSLSCALVGYRCGWFKVRFPQLYREAYRAAFGRRF